MKFWTIQDKSVIETALSEGLFQPEFSKSRYLNISEDLADLYDFVLRSFNKINDTNLPGLIYAFARSEGKYILQLENFDEFYAFINEKKAALEGFWNKLDKENVVIAELEYDETFNPVFVDINDFQFLMPPIMALPPYTQESFEMIIKSISIGQAIPSPFPSHVMQAHLPNIKKENIINIYPIFDFN